MSRRNSHALLLVILCCVCAAAQTSPQTATPGSPNSDETTTGNITGSVVNESGQPFAGAQVTLRQLNSALPARTATTDSEGTFRVAGLSPALYIVSANAPGYIVPQTDANLPINHHRLGDSVRLELIRGGVITGSVTNAAGEPLIAVNVRAWLVRDAQGQPAKIPSTFYMEQTTDDRGIYRLFGLMPGSYVVAAGGSGFSQRFQLSAFTSDAPTYAPSSTRDAAAEVTVHSGEEADVDIRYRGEPGHSISGSVRLASTAGASITLSSPGGAYTSFGSAFQQFGTRGFEFSGLADGDYVIVAREVIRPVPPHPSALFMSEPRRITVKGADVTGLELVTKPLASLSGRFVLEPTKPAECEGKRRPLFSEMIVILRRHEKDAETELLPFATTSASGSPDAEGSFAISNLTSGRYLPQPNFYARYWYLNSMTLTGPAKTDAAANWTTVKFGEHADLTISLAEGAASIRGRVNAAAGAQLPSGLGVYLVPAEREKSANVLRYFVSALAGDATFAFNNLPPGRYLALLQTLDPQATTLETLRLPEAADVRTKLHRAAETQKTNLELKPCQNLTDYQLAFK